MNELIKAVFKFGRTEIRDAEEWIAEQETGGRGNSRDTYRRIGYAEGVKDVLEMIEEHCLMNGIELPEEVTEWES